MADKQKQLNLRPSESEREVFNKMASRLGLTQSELFSKLLSNAQTDELKVSVPDLADEIDAVNAHITAIRTAYEASVSRYKDADAAAAEKVRNQLLVLSREAQAAKELRTENAELKESMETLRAENARLTSELSQITETTDEVSQLRDENMRLREELISIKEVHESEIKKVRDEEFAKLMQFVQASR